MKEADFFKIIGKLSNQDEYAEFIQHMDNLFELLDELDCDDVFGTEGWRHAIGLDD